MTANAEIFYVNIEPNKFNEEQTQLSIGFKDENDKVIYMRYTIAGGTEGQTKFGSMQLSKLLKHGGPYPVRIEKDERDKDQVYFEDGFRSGGGAAAKSDDDLPW